MEKRWTPEQEAAMTINGKTLLVSAAAGSGKTSVLTERIIRSLLDKEHPADLSRMLIVTFTRAAAAELKGRIAEALGNALAENPGNDTLSRQLFLLGSAQISTIDSFFQKAVKENFEQLSIPATFRIADNAEMLRLKHELLDTLIEEFYKKYTPTDFHDAPFDRIYKNDFAKAIDHLISNRSDGKLYEVLLDFYNRFSSDPKGIKRLSDCAAQLRIDAERDFFASVYGREILARLKSPFEDHAKFLDSVAMHLEENDYIRSKYGDAVFSDREICKSLTAALAEESYEKAYACVSAIGKPKGLPGGKIQKTEQIIGYQIHREAFKNDLDTAKKLLCYAPAELKRQCIETADAFSMLYEFFEAFENRLFLEKKERGTFEFDDIRTMLYGLLHNSDGSPTPYAKSLASQYDIVYIDEYQDVDLIQDRIFARVGGNNRFMVGDIKQSIYGFRGSDPSIFSEYRRSMPLHTDPAAAASKSVCVFMSSNFRCNDPVIRFANKVCSFLFSACEKSIGYKPQDDLVLAKRMPETLPEGHPTPVCVEVFDCKPRGKAHISAEEDPTSDEDFREEARWVAKEISRLLREEKLDNGKPINPSDIAIITRKHKQNAIFCGALSAAGIPVSAASRGEILHDPLLVATLNLLRAVDNPYRDLPLTEFLLSEFGGFTLAELTEIRDASEHGIALYDAMIQFSTNASLLSDKVKHMLSYLDTQRERAAVQPADRFLRLLYLEEAFLPHTGSAPLLFLYDQARNCQKTAFCGIYSFLSHIDKVTEEGKISADGFKKAENAVTVITVHHSKGLEFPIVFLGAAGNAFNMEDLKKTILYQKDLGAATKLYNSETGALEETAIHNVLKSRVKEEQTEEEIRSLYVALTRARERLYVTGTLSGKWENAQQTAAAISYGDRYGILGVSNALKWILSALSHDADGVPFTLTHHPLGSVGALASVKTEEVSAPELPQKSESPLSQRLATIGERHQAFRYPKAHLEGLPSKIAASRLCPGILDTLDSEETNEASLDRQIELMCSRPRFDSILKADKDASAADVGTAMHAFLEFCDFQRLAELGVENECKQLLDDGYLTEQTKALLDLDQLELLRKSDLMKMLTDTIDGKMGYQREQKFSLMLPMAQLTEDKSKKEALAEETVFVQGSIDLLLLMPDGKRILIDYKTDRLYKGERENPELLRMRLQNAHADQLACYARAVRSMFGAAPDEIRIYSVPLGKTVIIDTTKSFLA